MSSEKRIMLYLRTPFQARIIICYANTFYNTLIVFEIMPLSNSKKSYFHLLSSQISLENTEMEAKVSPTLFSNALFQEKPTINIKLWWVRIVFTKCSIFTLLFEVLVTFQLCLYAQDWVGKMNIHNSEQIDSCGPPKPTLKLCPAANFPCWS